MEGKCQRMKRMSLLKFFPIGLVAMAEIIGWLASAHHNHRTWFLEKNVTFIAPLHWNCSSEVEARVGRWSLNRKHNFLRSYYISCIRTNVHSLRGALMVILVQALWKLHSSLMCNSCKRVILGVIITIATNQVHHLSSLTLMAPNVTFID
jgi:hypothetical protein